MRIENTVPGTLEWSVTRPQDGPTYWCQNLPNWNTQYWHSRHGLLALEQNAGLTVITMPHSRMGMSPQRFFFHVSLWFPALLLFTPYLLSPHVLSTFGYQKSVEPSKPVLSSLSQTLGPGLPRFGATKATSWEIQGLDGSPAVLSLPRGYSWWIPPCGQLFSMALGHMTLDHDLVSSHKLTRSRMNYTQRGNLWGELQGAVGGNRQ